MLSQLQKFYRIYGVWGSLKRFSESPRKIQALFNDNSHFYTNELPVLQEDIATIIPSLIDIPVAEALSYWRELDSSFSAEIENRLRMTSERPDLLHKNWREFIYVLVRATSPSIIVETGTHDGLGSAYILYALDANGHGELITVDINDQTQLPSDLGSINAGWVVPDSFRDRWDLRFADARNELPQITEEVEVDMFLHDSLHTREHMNFEFSMIHPALSEDAVVICDNSRFNDVFWKFSRKYLEKAVFWRNTSQVRDHDRNIVDDRLGIGVRTS